MYLLGFYLITILHSIFGVIIGFEAETLSGKMIHSLAANFINKSVLIESFNYLLYLLIFHFFCAILLWISFDGMLKLASNNKSKKVIFILLGVLFCVWITAANYKFYDHTSLIAVGHNDALFYVGAVFFGALLIYRLVFVHLRLLTVFAGGVFAFLLVGAEGEYDNKHVDRSRPDIIIVGIDSLRGDYVDNGLLKQLMPNLDQFLHESEIFKYSYTPLARTYPSWISILTGMHPREHGIRFNLADNQNLNKKDLLSLKLKNLGYTTLYAIDETRFSHIDESYGFDITIFPKPHALDFLIDKISDAPLMNFANSFAFLERYVSKVGYLNRAHYRTYDPVDFDNQIRSSLDGLDDSKPLFMAVHYELAHWPYKWRNSSSTEIQGHKIKNAKTIQDRYNFALMRVDQQFKNLINALDSYGRLNNAIVFLISDHGEGFAIDGSQVRGIGNMVLPPFYGHGLNVLDRAQTRPLISLKMYGENSDKYSVNAERIVSLVDIKGAALFYAQLGEDYRCHLLDVLTDCSTRVLFGESGFNVPSMLRSNSINESVLFKEAFPFYDIDKHGRMVIKKDLHKSMLIGKQRAAYESEYTFASIPLGDELGYVLLRSSDGLTELMASGFAALDFIEYKDSKKIINSFCEHYGLDDLRVAEFCKAFDQMSFRRLP